jgi:glyoxylase-like metal-dependent hydrolase (beta-lactamase superfamily II)
MCVGSEHHDSRSEHEHEPAPPPPVERYDDGIQAIDTLTGGMTSVTAGYLLAAPRPALIECGPALSIANVIAGLRSLGMDPDDLAYLIVTHIHLDHAGGAGDVAEAFPNATVVVSDVGARHLHEPDRLNRSASQAMGTPSVEYRKAKAIPPIRPSCVSVRPSSAWIGSFRIPRICRSRKLNV